MQCGTLTGAAVAPIKVARNVPEADETPLPRENPRAYEKGNLCPPLVFPTVSLDRS